MNGNFIEIVGEMISYILDARIVDIPRYFLKLLAIVVVAYTAQSILIGLPISIWEAVTKKKVQFEIKSKIDFRVTLVFTIILILFLLYQKVM